MIVRNVEVVGSKKLFVGEIGEKSFTKNEKLLSRKNLETPPPTPFLNPEIYFSV
jgi:hypothetical protein